MDRDAVHDPAREEVLGVARRLAARPSGRASARPDPAERARRFFEANPEAEQERAAELLELGRASWRLRDDDNLYLGRLLIHGAIIAREYGLPCVTGVPLATALIHTGDRLTIDGYLGIVVIG